MHPAYCAPRPLSPVLPARRALPLTICARRTAHLAPAPHPNRSQNPQPTLDVWRYSPVLCKGAVAAATTGTHLGTQQAVLLACTLNCTCLCEYRSYGSDGARSSQSCS